MEKFSQKQNKNRYWYFLCQKIKSISCFCFKTSLKSWKKCYDFYDFNWRRWHYITAEQLLTLLKGITSKHHRDFFCLHYVHSFATANKPGSQKKVCENKDFFNVVVPSEDTELLQFNKNQKQEKVTFIIYADLECF